jgi:hypothetical protein
VRAARLVVHRGLLSRNVGDQSGRGAEKINASASERSADEMAAIRSSETGRRQTRARRDDVGEVRRAIPEA